MAPSRNVKGFMNINLRILHMRFQISRFALEIYYERKNRMSKTYRKLYALTG